MDDILCIEEDLLLFLEHLVLHTTLIAFDTSDGENSLFRGEEPGSLRIIGKEEPAVHFVTSSLRQLESQISR